MHIALNYTKRVTSFALATILALSVLLMGASAQQPATVKDDLTIGVVNFHPTWGEKDANLKKMLTFIDQAAEKKVQMLLFPEMCLTGYADGTLADGSRMTVALAEAADGNATKSIAAKAKQYNMYIVYGLTEAIKDSKDTAYNTAVAIGPAGIIGTYRKIHPVEGTWCVPGETPCLLDTPWGPVGLGICYDNYATPELERYYIAKGARLILNPTASARGYKDGNSTGWEWYYNNRLESIADRDGVFVASANLLGVDGTQKLATGADQTFDFPGGSMVTGPIADAKSSKFLQTYAGSSSNKKETLDIATIDLKLANRSLFVSANWQPELYTKWYAELAQKKLPRAAAAYTDTTLYPDSTVKIGVVNFAAKWGDKAANLESMKKYIADAAKEKLDILVFPEMALTGYNDDKDVARAEKMQVKNAETVPGASSEALAALAKQNNMYIIFGLPEKDKKDETKIYNSAAILSPDGTIASYQKIHPVGDEPNWCIRGSTPYMFTTPWGPIGMSICFDTYAIPELERYYAASGCKIVINPTATARGSTIESKWEWYYSNRLESATDRDGIVIASANLVSYDGPEGKGYIFPGGSVVISSAGTAGVYHAGKVANREAGLITSSEIDLFTRGFKIIGFTPALYSKLYKEAAELKTTQAKAAASSSSMAASSSAPAVTTTAPAVDKPTNPVIYVLLSAAALYVVMSLSKKPKKE